MGGVEFGTATLNGYAKWHGNLKWLCEMARQKGFLRKQKTPN